MACIVGCCCIIPFPMLAVHKHLSAGEPLCFNLSCAYTTAELQSDVARYFSSLVLIARRPNNVTQQHHNSIAWHRCNRTTCLLLSPGCLPKPAWYSVLLAD